MLLPNNDYVSIVNYIYNERWNQDEYFGFKSRVSYLTVSNLIEKFDKYFMENERELEKLNNYRDDIDYLFKYARERFGLYSIGFFNMYINKLYI